MHFQLASLIPAKNHRPASRSGGRPRRAAARALTGLLLALVLPFTGRAADDSLLSSSLALLDAEFSAGKEAAERPLKTLSEQYRNALTRRMIDAQEAGDLPGVLAAREAAGELDRGVFPPEAVIKDPKVREMRRLYTEKRAPLLRQVQANLAPARRQYLQGLEALVASLTKAGAIEDASRVEALKETALKDMLANTEAPAFDSKQIAGEVVAWGENNHGQTTIPAGLSGVTAIKTTNRHNLALQKDGTVVAWGWNSEGQATVPEGLTGVTAIAGGWGHSLALKKDRTVVAWGANDNGQTTVPKGLTGITAIAAGDNHSLALKKDRTVVAWGANDNGQTTVPKSLSGVTAIAAGDNYSLALKQDGTVVAWGFNNAGQTNVPKGLSQVTAIDAGGEHCLALKKNGTVVAWGHNAQGQCNVPKNLTGVTAIASGNNHALALKSDGTVVAWGHNAQGQCNVPKGLTGVTAISAGSHHSLALKTKTP